MRSTLTPQDQENRILTLFWNTDDYRDFLQEICEQKLSPKLKSYVALAKLLDVSPSFVTKIFSKKSHLSLEQGELVAKALGFEINQTLAFLDRISLTRTTSPGLKSVLSRRLKMAFDAYYSAEAPAKPRDGALTSPPGSLLYFKIASLLNSDEGVTLKQLSERSRIGKERLEFLLGKMRSHFTIESFEKNGATYYRMGPSQYRPREASSNSLFELGMSLRRLASYSLESRHPIHLVDDSEHYVSGSYIMPLDAQQIRELSQGLSQLTKSITQTALQSEPRKDAKFVGICFDMFDIDL